MKWWFWCALLVIILIVARVLYVFYDIRRRKALNQQENWIALKREQLVDSVNVSGYKFCSGAIVLDPAGKIAFTDNSYVVWAHNSMHWDEEECGMVYWVIPWLLHYASNEEGKRIGDVQLWIFNDGKEIITYSHICGKYDLRINCDSQQQISREAFVEAIKARQ